MELKRKIRKYLLTGTAETFIFLIGVQRTAMTFNIFGFSFFNSYFANFFSQSAAGSCVRM